MKDLFGFEFREPEKKKLNHSAKVAHLKLIVWHGESVGNKCKNCDHLVRKDFSKVYYKCSKFRQSGSLSSDWRVNWKACGLFKNSSNESI
jgi:hypothetical protein